MKLLILCGPPGCGKTILAKAMQDAYGNKNCPVITDDNQLRWISANMKAVVVEGIREQEIARWEELVIAANSENSLNTPYPLVVLCTQHVPSEKEITDNWLTRSYYIFRKAATS